MDPHNIGSMNLLSEKINQIQKELELLLSVFNLSN